MRIGIDLGGTKIAGIVLDDAGRTLVARRVPTPAAFGYRAVIDAIAALTRWLEEQVGERCTIGIGTPGQISRRHGTIKNSNAQCLNDQPLEQDLERVIARPIRMANDANCFTLSEAIDGAAADYEVVFGVIIGTGVGGAITVGKKVLPGRHGIAGEWGHIQLEDDAEYGCYCGRRGCIETYLSGMGLVREYHARGGTEAYDAAQVARLATSSDDLAAKQAVDRYAERLGRALSLIVHILDPDAIVLGGGLSNIGTIYQQGHQYMQPHVFNDELDIPLLKHAHGDASGVRGAAMLWPSREAAATERTPSSHANIARVVGPVLGHAKPAG